MRLSGKTQPITSPHLIRNNPVKDAAMIVAEVEEPAALMTAVPHQAIGALPRMPQTDMDGARRDIEVARTAAG